MTEMTDTVSTTTDRLNAELAFNANRADHEPVTDSSLTFGDLRAIKSVLIASPHKLVAMLREAEPESETDGGATLMEISVETFARSLGLSCPKNHYKLRTPIGALSKASMLLLWTSATSRLPLARCMRLRAEHCSHQRQKRIWRFLTKTASPTGKAHTNVWQRGTSSCPNATPR